jgi:hypothetical protein
MKRGFSDVSVDDDDDAMMSTSDSFHNLPTIPEDTELMQIPVAAKRERSVFHAPTTFAHNVEEELRSSVKFDDGSVHVTVPLSQLKPRHQIVVTRPPPDAKPW